MGDYKFDGKELRLRGSRVGVLDGKSIRDGHGSLVGRVDGQVIRDSHGSTVARFDGREIRDAHGMKIGSLEDVRDDIEGVGGASLVAMWILLVR